MTLAAALVYWVIVALWLTVLSTVIYFYVRNPHAFGTTRLLLAVLTIDTLRNIFENVYFGLYFGGRYGVFSSELVEILGSPILLILPKLFNVLAGCVVLGLLLWRWLPLAVNERKKAEDDRTVAERTAHLKDEFIATVSHELRTPVTSISVSLELLADAEEEIQSAETRELIAIARTNCDRLARLVNDILDVEKLEGGKVVFNIQRIEPDLLLGQTMDANRPLAESRGVQLRFERASHLELLADPDRLTQVVTNLLSNALKFSPPGAEVVVRVEDCEDKVRISVRDHGPGIPDEFKSRIFEKFAQADGARAKTGTGLGLSIAREIVHRLGGEIGFADAAGGGMVFWVALPGLSRRTKGHETSTPMTSADPRLANDRTEAA